MSQSHPQRSRTSQRQRPQRPHLRMMPFTPSSPSPSPLATTPASVPTTYFLSCLPSVPSIIITPPVVLPNEAPVESDYIAQARRRRMRRTPPPSPHLLCVGWRRRADSYPDAYGLVSDRQRSRHRGGQLDSGLGGSVSRSTSRALTFVAGAIATISETDFSAVISSALSNVSNMASYIPMPEKKEAADASLPLYRRRKRTTSPRPLALFAFLFTIALGLSLVLHGGLAASATPIASSHQRSHTGAAPRHAFGHTVSGRYYDTRRQPPTAPAAGAGHLSASAYYSYDGHQAKSKSHDGGNGVGVTLPKTRKVGAAQMRDIVDAFSAGGVLNPWDFH